jgi:hypothetical protein
MRKLVSVLVLAFALAACAAPSGGDARKGGAVKPYPLETCLVTGTRLGSMGDPVVKVYDGQEIRFCCESCVPEFESDPAKFLEKLPR